MLDPQREYRHIYLSFKPQVDHFMCRQVEPDLQNFCTHNSTIG